MDALWVATAVPLGGHLQEGFPWPANKFRTVVRYALQPPQLFEARN